MLCFLLSLVFYVMPSGSDVPPYALDAPHEHPDGWVCRMEQWKEHRPIDDGDSNDDGPPTF